MPPSPTGSMSDDDAGREEQKQQEQHVGNVDADALSDAYSQAFQAEVPDGLDNAHGNSQSPNFSAEAASVADSAFRGGLGRGFIPAPRLRIPKSDATITSGVGTKVSIQPTTVFDIETGQLNKVYPEDIPQGRLGQSHNVGKLDASGTLKVQVPVADALNNDAFFQVFQTDISGLVQVHERSSASDFAAAKTIQAENQVGCAGAAWRSALKTIILLANDQVNALMYTRGLQIDLPFLTGYESYLLSTVIGAFDSGDRALLKNILSHAFQNRNVSRILVVNMARYDILWHWSFQFKHNRLLDAWSRFPIIGFGAFPATENFPSSKYHAITSIGRVLLGQGTWWTRAITNREGLVVDDSTAASQNLAAETNGFEAANRNQFGTYFGRKHVNEFRFEHRLTTDESVVRTFVTSPISTMTNNGAEHVLRAMANHWRNILSQPSGNFAHQRMEQINPFETMRYHMPLVLLHLTTLRGINRWDSKILTPFVHRLQRIKPMSDLNPLRAMVQECKTQIVEDACGGIQSRIEPFQRWLDSIADSINVMEDEVTQVYDLIRSVELGIRCGHSVASKVDWTVPSFAKLERAILECIAGTHLHGDGISCVAIKRSLNILSPKDKRTLISLVKGGQGDSRPAQLLLGRAYTLLQRELRRDATGRCVRDLSKGKIVDGSKKAELVEGWLYWITGPDGKEGVYRYGGRMKAKRTHRFIDVQSGSVSPLVLNQDVMVRTYIPVAEAIVRAQRAFMDIETKHGKKFSYSAFMEIPGLRLPLRKLCVLAQIHCEELDDARLNTLKSLQLENLTQVPVNELEIGTIYYKYENNSYIPFKLENEESRDDLARTLIVRIPPQHIQVVGGGPTGLITTLHNIENVLISGGTITLSEARDAFIKAGATFERAQIVRLDSRWISMLRYHLGSLFENIWVPASGETDSHLGNTLSDQGFVEITIKDLEDVLQVEITRLASKGLLQQNTQAALKYDPVSNHLAKEGKALKVGDLVLRRVSPDLTVSEKYFTWKVTEIVFNTPLTPDKVELQSSYEIYNTAVKMLISYRCVGIDLDARTIKFRAKYPDELNDENLKYMIAQINSFPSVYPAGTENREDALSIRMECVTKDHWGSIAFETFEWKSIKSKKFAIDVSNTHVIECIGKPKVSNVHLLTTTKEPHGVCCIGGLKISMGMHNFGNKRWGQGIVDDVRSQTDQNTRIIGDFTKNVRIASIADKMTTLFHKRADLSWQHHFNELSARSGLIERLAGESSAPKLAESLATWASMAPECRRTYLQTRFFETGDNYYLGMEFAREFAVWKVETIKKLCPSYINMDESEKELLKKYKTNLEAGLDRLWFAATLEVIRTGDVYNPGARRKVPVLYLIDSKESVLLSKLPVGEAFSTAKSPEERYEVLIKPLQGAVVCRDVEGNTLQIPGNEDVHRQGNLTRGPDGILESKVALASFPVGHYVNHRTMRLNDEKKGYVYVFIGDEQSTPHFMRYSGLTGAGINAMLFNEFVEAAIQGSPFVSRIRTYARETNWSNGEVVQRGTGNNYGQDGFLRPGFTYREGLDYLYAKVIESRETLQIPELSRDWKIKFAASIVPRGLERNELFLTALKKEVRMDLLKQLQDHIEDDEIPKSEPNPNQAIKQAIDEVKAERRELSLPDVFWNEFSHRLSNGALSHNISAATQVELMVDQVIEQAQRDHERNGRLSGELFNQPKPVDYVVDDFAVEAQNFTNTLTMTATLAAAALALRLTGSSVVGSAILSAFTPIFSFGSIANGSRYKSRNEEAREEWYDERYLPLMMDVFSQLTLRDARNMPSDDNPFIRVLEKQVKHLEESAQYFGEPEPAELRHNYEKLKKPKNANADTFVESLKALIAGKLVPIKYQKNSYMQEELMQIYLTLDTMGRLLLQQKYSEPSTESSSIALSLYRDLLDFEKRLKSSLQRGVIKWGFYKVRSWRHGHIVATITYFYHKICRLLGLHRAARPGLCYRTMTPMSIQTHALKEAMDRLKSLNPTGINQRRVQDLRYLYHATTESTVTSLIIGLAYVSFFTGILFTIGNIGIAVNPTSQGFELVTMMGAYSFGLITPVSALLSMLFLLRKLIHVFKLDDRFTDKLKYQASPTNESHNTSIRQVRAVTKSQELATTMRFVASAGAAIALPWALAVQVGWSRVLSDVPLYIAVGSLGLQILTIVFLFFIEYSIRYNFSPRLGEHICVHVFQSELTKLYEELSIPHNDIETKQVQDRKSWEYVAREFVHRYRFDTVLQADRFGNVFHFVQSGCSPELILSPESVSEPFEEEQEAPDDITYFTGAAPWREQLSSRRDAE